MLAAPAVTAWNVLAGLSTSVSVSVPLAVGVPGVPLATPPASITEPVLVPLITAASLLPLIVTVTVFAVPSAVKTLNVSLSVPPALRACTVALLLFSV